MKTTCGRPAQGGHPCIKPPRHRGACYAGTKEDQTNAPMDDTTARVYLGSLHIMKSLTPIYSPAEMEAVFAFCLIGHCAVLGHSPDDLFKRAREHFDKQWPNASQAIKRGQS